MFDLKNSHYFNSLPKYVQEGIMQTGLDFQDEEDLQLFASDYENTAE